MDFLERHHLSSLAITTFEDLFCISGERRVATTEAEGMVEAYGSIGSFTELNGEIID
jgi:hypothetical protein